MRRQLEPALRDLAPLVAAWVACLGVLTVERELGASLLIFGVVLAMLYAATSRVAWVIVGLVFLAAGCVAGYTMFAHVQTRVHVWLNPGGDYLGSGYQISQSLFGLGTGGLGGTGLGAGRPDMVPLANADFITAAIGEELGMIGLAALLLLYLLLIMRGFKAALVCRDPFGTLLAAGLSVTIALQVVIVVGGVTNLIPETGLATPFLSYGGSSLLANYILVALLLRISDAARRPAPERAPRPALADASTELAAPPHPDSPAPPGAVPAAPADSHAGPRTRQTRERGPGRHPGGHAGTRTQVRRGRRSGGANGCPAGYQSDGPRRLHHRHVAGASDGGDPGEQCAYRHLPRYAPVMAAGCAG